MVQIIREFSPADRYLYDFGACSIANGWAQIDTQQDASYYGQWINPIRREIFTYCEGDTILTRCETDAELVEEFTKLAQWNLDMGYKPVRIDPGFSVELQAAFTRLDMTMFFHPSEVL